MYNYLETFLGESTRALWESYKTNFRENYNNMLSLGANPYNFVNQIGSLSIIKFRTNEDKRLEIYKRVMLNILPFLCYFRKWI